MKPCTSATSAARRRQPGADRPDRLVGDRRGSRRSRRRAASPRAGAPTTSSVRPPSRSAWVSPMQTMARQPGAPRGLRLGAHVGVGLLVIGAPLRMADDDGARAGIREHLGRDVAGEGAGGLGVAILAADRRPAEPRARREGRRPASPAGRSAGRPGAPGRARPRRSASSSAAEPCSPFIFQLPATSGRARCHRAHLAFNRRQRLAERPSAAPGPPRSPLARVAWLRRSAATPYDARLRAAAPTRRRRSLTTRSVACFEVYAKPLPTGSARSSWPSWSASWSLSFAIWGIGDIFRGFGRSTVAKIGAHRDHDRAVPPDLQ